MTTSTEQALQQQIISLQNDLDEYRLHADFCLAIQTIMHNCKNSTAGSIGSTEVISMAVDNLLEKTDKNTLTTQELRKELEQIKFFAEITTKSIQKIEALSKEILTKGKADKSHDIETFDLNELIRNEINFLKYTSPFIKSKIDISIDLNDDPILISARKHDIVQVFENLVHNALESIKKEGKITIESNKDDKFAYFQISDTGPGIPKQKIQQIFEPFFTTKNTGEKNAFFGGTGLGLHSCKKIIDLYHGEINVDGNLKPGSKFSVKLPIN
jgi:signal transduction histidine kinase